MTEIYLIRHSEKMRGPTNMWEVFDRIQPLSVRGEEKAKALLNMECLRNADVAYTSPFARTLATLRYLMEADGFSITMDERLRELDFGGDIMKMGPPPQGGKPPRPDPNDIRVRQWQDRDLADVGGESLNQCCARMAEAVEEIGRNNPGKKVLVGTHGAAIGAYLSSLIPGVDNDFTREIGLPDVFRLIFEEDRITSVERLELPEGAK